MAQEVSIAGSQCRAKIRHPVGVFGLTIITLGVYGWFWWYFINRELRDLGRERAVSGLGDNPGLSCAAFVLGGWAFYIPLIWTIVTTTQRIQAGQRLACERQDLNGWIALLLWIFTLGIGGIIYTQSQINQIWQTQTTLTHAGIASGHMAGDADLDRLQKLSALKDSGALSEEEFEAEKAKLLPDAQASSTGQQPES